MSDPPSRSVLVRLEHDLDGVAQQPLKVVAGLEDDHALHILGWHVFSQPLRLISSRTIL